VARNIKVSEAIKEATDLCMAKDSSVYMMGLGIPQDPFGLFGTTTGLYEKYGPDRIMDMPTAENGMTGVAIGSTMVGMRPIMAHQRMEFAMLSVEQIINQAANWYYMFEKQGFRMPLVVRMFIGRGWGQGPQHSQSFQSMYAHCPGLKVVMPATPHDAKGLMIAAIEDDNPVIYLEHRWIHNVFGDVPEEHYSIPIGEARVATEGNDVTLVSSSYMTLEAIRCAELMKQGGINVEVIDLRTISPLDKESIFKSVRKTGRLVVADPGWKSFGVGAEILALVAEELHGELSSKPVRITFPDVPLPSSPGLSKLFYPRTIHLMNAIYGLLGLPEKTEVELGLATDVPFDIPDKSFTGPF